MAITPLETDLNIIAALDDEPNDVGGLTAAQLKAKFDEGGNAIKAYINGILIPGTQQEINEVAGGVALGQIPDGTITPAKLSGEIYTNDDICTAATKALCGFDSDAVPNDVLVQIHSVVSKANSNSLLRDLNIMLNLALGTSNIDAWADLLTDDSQINSSSGVSISAGKASAILSQTLAGNSWSSMGMTNPKFIGQTITLSSSPALSLITFGMYRNGSPTGNVALEVYTTSGGIPNTLVYTSSTIIPAGSISDSLVDVSFDLNGFTITSGIEYAFVLKYSGPYDNANYVYVLTCSGGGISNGNKIVFDGSN